MRSSWPVDGLELAPMKSNKEKLDDPTKGKLTFWSEKIEKR